MTDKEIIKALECCIKKECTNCPHKKMFCSDTVAMEHALDLTKRQQKEIERLKIENQSLRSAANSYKLHYNKARTEAVKEFAERLKNKIKIECNPYGRPTFDYETSIAIMRYIDNFVEGMVGENNDRD